VRTVWGMALVAWAASVSAVSAPPADQPRVPTFSSDVEIVTVDVVVLDDQGRPERGLKRGDFVVLEDGQPQQVVGFDAYERTAPSQSPTTGDASPAAPVVQNDAASDDTERSFAVIIDDLGLDPARSIPAVKEAVALWLREGTDGRDEVTLVTTSGDVWWTDRVGGDREDLLAVLSRVAGKGAAHGTEEMSAWEAFSIPREAIRPPQNPCSTTPLGSLGGLRTLTDRVVERWSRLGRCLCCNFPEPQGCLESCAAEVRTRAREIHQGTVRRQRALLGAIGRVSKALTARRGRKSIMVLSEVFIRDTRDELAEAFQDAIDASRRANTVVDFIDARGLMTSSLYSAASRVAPNPRDVGAVGVEDMLMATDGAEYLANATGGFLIRNTNDMAVGLDRMENESRAYYLLSYQPQKPPDGRWHDLDVQVSRADVKVRARRGYFARPALPAEPRDTRAEDNETHKGKDRDASSRGSRALDLTVLAAGAQNGIPLRMACYVLGPAESDSVRVQVALEVDMSGIERVSKNEAPTATLDLTILALSRDQPSVIPLDERLEVAGDGESGGGWLELTRELRVPPGIGQVRALVRDVRRGTRGLVAQRIEVPDPEQFFISTPILSDRLMSEPDKSGRVKLRPVAYRHFRAQGHLYCLYEVFGAGREQAGGPSQVAGGYVLQSQGGEVIAASPPTLIASSGGGPISRLLGLTLEGLAPGVYELALGIEDRVTGRTLTRRDTFVVESP
jgi:VWFA-related protein